MIQVRNRSDELDVILKPFGNIKNLKFSDKERFVTHNSIHYKDLGHRQRIENLKLEKDDIKDTRRIMDNYNNKSISTAANKVFSFTCKKEAINRLRKYVKDPTPFEDSPEGMAS